MSKEKHKDGGEHLHIYIKLDARIDIMDKKRLDIEDGQGKKVHGNYQSCRSYRNVIGYIVKDGMANVYTNKELDEKGREING